MSTPHSESAVAFVIEDDPFACRALGQFLETQGFIVLTEVTYAGAHRLIATHPPPRLAIVDLMLRDDSGTSARRSAAHGISLVHDLKRRDPTVAIVIWTAYSNHLAPLLPLLTRGYTGLACVAKGSPEEELLTAITRALQQDIFLSVDGAETVIWERLFLDALDPAVAQQVVDLARGFENLTPQQYEVAKRMTWTPEAIARQLGLKVSTVRKYIDTLYDRLGLKDEEMVAGYRRETLLVLAHTLRRLWGDMGAGRQGEEQPAASP